MLHIFRIRISRLTVVTTGEHMRQTATAADGDGRRWTATSDGCPLHPFVLCGFPFVNQIAFFVSRRKFHC